MSTRRKNIKSTQETRSVPFKLGIFSPGWSEEFKKGAGRKPKWQIRTRDGFKDTPTVAETEQERVSLLKSLERKPYASDKIAKKLAKPLAECAPKARCKTLYCPTCAQKQAMMFTREVFAFQNWHKPVWRASLIPDCTIAQDALDDGDGDEALDLAEEADDLVDDAQDAIGNSGKDVDDQLDDAFDELDDAWDEFDEADANGDNTGDAEDLLEEAEDLLDDAETALDDGDDDEAEDLIDEALDLIDDARDEL